MRVMVAGQVDLEHRHAGKGRGRSMRKRQCLTTLCGNTCMPLWWRKSTRSLKQSSARTLEIPTWNRMRVKRFMHFLNVQTWTCRGRPCTRDVGQEATAGFREEEAWTAGFWVSVFWEPRTHWKHPSPNTPHRTSSRPHVAPVNRQQTSHMTPVISQHQTSYMTPVM